MELLKKELDENGVGVLPGVLSEAQCDTYITQLQEWLSKFGGGFPESRSAIINDYNIAHHPAVWHTRLQVAPVFEALWGTEKIVSSIDGIAIGQPPEQGKESFAAENPLHFNLHLDQGGSKHGLHAYQGAVYLEEALEDDWCFLVMNKSHHYHHDFYSERTKKPPRTEFLRLTKKEIDWYLSRGCSIKRIAVPRGGIVLWDSRTVHAGARPLMDRRNPERWRFVVFACMAPAVWASETERARKKNGFRKMMCSKHWPAQGFSLFRGKHVDPKLNAVDELPEVALTTKARLLAGDISYVSDGRPEGPEKPKIV